jgi:hypothetical protein
LESPSTSENHTFVRIDPTQTTYSSAKRRAIAERRALVADLYLRQKKTQGEIAAELDCCPFTVCEDLKALTAQWQKQARDEVVAHIVRELLRLDAVEREAWDSFQASKRAHSVATVSKRQDPIDAKLNSTIQTVTQIERPEGDVKWLNAILHCIDERCTLLGLRGALLRELGDKAKTEPKTFEDFVALHLENTRKATPTNGPMVLKAHSN